MKKELRDFFFFNRKQKTGALIFAALTLINVAILWIDPFSSVEATDYSMYIQAAEEFERRNASSNAFEAAGSEGGDYKESFHFFDPNTETEDGFIANNFHEKLAARIIRFRSKGGKFRSADDLKKVYGMNEDLFEKIRPFVRIEHAETGSERTPAKEIKAVAERKMLELNTADSLELVSLPGIGPGFAKRILSFRKKLGGFIRKEQLMEVYGFDSAKYSIVERRITANESVVRRINLNSMESELAAHPYIGKYLAKRIVAYRASHGDFSSSDEIFLLQGIEKSKLEKAKDYLTIE